MSQTITIELRNLRFFAHHGWHDEEAILGNEFEVTFLALFPAQETITAIDHTVDYTKVYDIIKTVFAHREKLLETVAQKISNQVESGFPQIIQMQLTITKLNPLIENFIGTVGITYAKDFR